MKIATTMNNSKFYPDVLQEMHIESCAALFYIFLNDEYLGWDCFTKGKVLIGSGNGADLILDDGKVSNIHALVHVKDGKIIISDETNGESSGVYVNSYKVMTCEIGPFDYVRIGDYTIKVKTKVQKDVKELRIEEPEQKKVSIEVQLLEPAIIAEEKPEENDPEIKEESEIIEAALLINEDEEDEDETLFFLKDTLVKENRGSGRRKEKEGKDAQVIEIIKWKEDRVIDVSFLAKKEKYFYDTKDGTFCIAENENSRDFYFYFTDRVKGKIVVNGVCKNTDSLCVEENLYRKKEIYRHLLPENGEVSISDGDFFYLLRRVDQAKTVHIPCIPKEKGRLGKNFVRSGLLHIIVFFLASVVSPRQKTTVTPVIEDRFVRIETPKPVPLKKRKKPVLKVVKPVVQKQKKKLVKRNASLPPKTGSGKKGNVKNKNINQTGILAALGLAEGIALQPGEALAAVTNLDAVVTTNAVEGNFKVGGVVAKLDTQGISIPLSEILTTKGSVQVLQSGGGNRVAALNSGSAGQGEVRGAVSARLNKTVRIRGGMSRETVKRVIDEHMEEVSYCYETELIANPSLMGKIVFEWQILLSGSVGEVRTKFSSINEGDINSCISQAIQSWQFPEPNGTEVTVSYPFIFDIVGF